MYGKGLSPLNQVLNLIRTGQPGGMGGGVKINHFMRCHLILMFFKGGRAVHPADWS